MSLCEAYEAAFKEKIKHFSFRKEYETLKTKCKYCLRFHTGCGYEQIVSADFMDRIIAMPYDYIEKWLDGENKLEWTPEFRDNLERARKSAYTEMFV